MIGTKESLSPVRDIVIHIHFVDGDSFILPVSIDEAGVIQEFLNWYRRPGRDKVWTWHMPTSAMLHTMQHAHIMAVDVEGYVEPDGYETRWWERLVDRILVWWWTCRG